MSLQGTTRGSEQFFWTEEGVARLKHLWIEGRTAVYIAKDLGTTRNAVLGKIWRLGLSIEGAPSAAAPEPVSHRRGPSARAMRSPAALAAPKPPKAARPPKAAPALRVVQAAPIAPPAPPPDWVALRAAAESGEGVSLLAREFGQCAWPINDPPAGCGDLMRYCGHATQGESSYCTVHARASKSPSAKASVDSLQRLINRPRPVRETFR